MKMRFTVRIVSSGVKRKLYEILVVPTKAYGLETWDMRVDEKHKVDIMEMKSLQSMCGMTRMDR